MSTNIELYMEDIRGTDILPLKQFYSGAISVVFAFRRLNESVIAIDYRCSDIRGSFNAILKKDDIKAFCNSLFQMLHHRDEDYAKTIDRTHASIHYMIVSEWIQRAIWETGKVNQLSKYS